MLYLSMDCERITDGSGLKGPASWEQSANSIKGFAKVVEEIGHHVEFFVTPTTAEAHKELFIDFKDRNHTISLHLHVPTFRDWYNGQKIELGNLSREKQKRIITCAIDDFTSALDLFPEGFRPGMASANHDTFEILTELGIKRGSVTIPNYVNKKYKTDWTGWSELPHDIETANGLFHNLPLTGNLWIDNDKISPNLLPLLEKAVNDSYLPIYTHNWVEFNKTSFQTKLLKSL